MREGGDREAETERLAGIDFKKLRRIYLKSPSRKSLITHGRRQTPQTTL